MFSTNQENHLRGGSHAHLLIALWWLTFIGMCYGAQDIYQEPLFDAEHTHAFTIPENNGTAKRLIQVTDIIGDMPIVRGPDNRYLYSSEECSFSSINQDKQDTSDSVAARVESANSSGVDRQKASKDNSLFWGWLGWLWSSSAPKAEQEKYSFRTYSVYVCPDLFFNTKSGSSPYQQPREGQKRIVLLGVHGTWMSAQSMGVDEQKINTQYLYDLARLLCQVYGVTVEIIACEWTGTLSQSARFHAGRNLASVIKNIIASYGPEAVHSMWSIAHSHGCNVVNYAVRQLQKEGYPHTIDVAFHTGSPEPDRKALPGKGEPFNYHQLYHFYASMDFTQAAGSCLQYGSFTRKMPFVATLDGYIYNIRLQHEGQHLNHTTIRSAALFNALGLLHAIETVYKNFHDLDANLFIDKLQPKRRIYPLVAVRRSEFNSIGADDEGGKVALGKSFENALIFERLYGRKFKQKPGLWDCLLMYKRERDARVKSRKELYVPLPTAPY